jgi:hypothetical protein
MSNGFADLASASRIFSPALSWVCHRRKTLAELGLLTFDVSLLVRFACLLLRSRSRGSATGNKNNGYGKK